MRIVTHPTSRRLRTHLGEISVPVNWLLCLFALSSLEFVQWSQTLAAATFTALSIIIVIRQPGKTLVAASREFSLWTYVLLCLASALWSPDPQTSVRGALEIALTIGAALTIGSVLPARQLVTAAMVASLIASIVSVGVNRYAMNAGVLAMIGIFGSKNQFGLCEALLLMTSLWIVCDAGRPLSMRAIALAGAFAGSILSIYARSMDSSVVVVAAFLCSYLAFKLGRFPLQVRTITLTGLVLSVVLLVSTILVAGNIDLFGTGLHLVGKDTTLTGRTVFWSRAAQVIRDNPFIGVGLQGFWVKGNPYAEELWARFAPGRTGINFHNMWYETGVQFGVVGLSLLLVIVLSTTANVLRWAIRSATPESCFFLAYTIFIDIRSFVESELLSEFSIMTIVLVCTRMYARNFVIELRTARAPYKNQRQGRHSAFQHRTPFAERRDDRDKDRRDLQKYLPRTSFLPHFRLRR